MSNLIHSLPLSQAEAAKHGLILRGIRDEFARRTVVEVYERQCLVFFLVGAFQVDDCELARKRHGLIDNWLEWQMTMIAKARRDMSENFKQFLAERGLGIQRSDARQVTFTIADLRKCKPVLIVELDSQQMIDMGPQGIETHIMASIVFGAPVEAG